MLFDGKRPAAPLPPVTVRTRVRQSRNDRAAPETRLPGEIQLGEADDGGSRIQAAQCSLPLQQALTLNAVDAGSGPGTFYRRGPGDIIHCVPINFIESFQ